MNLGEKNEILLKIYLTQLRNEGTFQSVGFNGIEYKSLPENINLKIVPNLSDYQLKSLADMMDISKAPSRAKSDVCIDGIPYSVKYSNAAPPALVNHTTRPGFEYACHHMGVNISSLDVLIDKYWDFRTKGYISEDTRIGEPNCPFNDAKEILRPILEYFLFIGTGSGISKHTAECILEYSSPSNPNTWNFLQKEEAVDILWPNLIFSLRSKGMPNGYPNNVSRQSQHKVPSIDRWTHFINNLYKGALHIRSK